MQVTDERKSQEFWINRFLREIGDRNTFYYQVHETENEAIAVKAQEYPKSVLTSHVRVVMPGEPDWRALSEEMAEALKETYMCLADCASRVKAPDSWMFDKPKAALEKFEQATRKEI